MTHAQFDHVADLVIEQPSEDQVARFALGVIGRHKQPTGILSTEFFLVYFSTLLERRQANVLLPHHHTFHLCTALTHFRLYCRVSHVFQSVQITERILFSLAAAMSSDQE